MQQAVAQIRCLSLALLSQQFVKAGQGLDGPISPNGAWGSGVLCDLCARHEGVISRHTATGNRGPSAGTRRLLVSLGLSVAETPLLSRQSPEDPLLLLDGEGGESGDVDVAGGFGDVEEGLAVGGGEFGGGEGAAEHHAPDGWVESAEL